MTGKWRFRWALACFGSALAAGPVLASPASFHREGISALNEGQPEEALAFFEKAERTARASDRDPAASLYNQGLALIRLGRKREAAEKLAAAMGTADLSLQARAHDALGALLGALGDKAAAEDARLPQAAKSYEESLRHLKSALRLKSGRPETKINFELARARLDEVRRRLEKQPPEPSEPGADPEKDPERSKQEEAKRDSDGDADSTKAENGKSKPDPAEPRTDSDPTQAGEEPAEPAPAGEGEEMSQEEARMILDAMRDQEELQRGRIRILRGELAPVERDW